MAKTNKTPKAEDNAELRTISLLKILNTYSDENHELSTKNIMDKLQKECGVTVHRTTVGKNIKQLAAVLIFTRTRRRRTAITLRAAYLRCRN
ncbi:hypothetical protein [Hominenteromicrobium sp.]|uniref:hypothetical protein n=1 Tax=Hominenteromicrobium sp. TaxID=3073581 RepID=UPI003A93023B